MVEAPVIAGSELLLDTCVYIDILQGRTPAIVDDFLQVRLVNHSTICLAEMTHLFGRLDPGHPGTRDALREIRRTIDDIPSHRLSAPSPSAMAEAGMLAGLVSRLRGVERGRWSLLLNDACLYVQAVEQGWTVLTRNVRDFDLFDQLIPSGRLLLYEP